ncbi:ABC transporter permease subunit [Halobacillus litoralis]|uniref:ABC transporter permease subunit n=1 Tax=Halobacillus litoralis TaxID=45668 RepID=A0A845E6G2_9BACI|nr:ABC transporter permease subunit [Halobacillus litoralis]MYL21254.1 ABC transporter permease subunit [Halobacillus litoralis]
MQWITIYKKEWLEILRNYKWIWVPLVFILFCIIDPLSTYYLPVIIEATGGLPEGAVFDLPTPPPSEAFMMSISQLNTLGVLVLALITMGSISGEKKSGVAELVLVKPVSYLSYLTAKWAAASTLLILSAAIGLIASWYYVQLLFGDLPFTAVAAAIFFYSLWILFLTSISLFMNAWSRIPGLVLFFTLAALMIMSLVTSVFSKYLAWSPARLSSYLRSLLITGDVPADLWYTSLVTAAMTLLLLYAGTKRLKKSSMLS